MSDGFWEWTQAQISVYDSGSTSETTKGMFQRSKYADVLANSPSDYFETQRVMWIHLQAAAQWFKHFSLFARESSRYEARQTCWAKAGAGSIHYNFDEWRGVGHDAGYSIIIVNTYIFKVGTETHILCQF